MLPWPYLFDDLLCYKFLLHMTIFKYCMFLVINKNIALLFS